MLTTDEFHKAEIFVVAVSKSACTITVAGKKCFKKCKANLAEDLSEEIEVFPSTTLLKFRLGRKVADIKRVIFPVVIAGAKCKINAVAGTEIIPFLLSKLLLSKCNAVINMT